MFSVHIIVVNYNAGDWLSRSVSAILRLTNFKVTIVDNNSTDNSVLQARQKFTNEPRLLWQINEENIGFAAANNQVLKNIEADFVLLINPDCEINKNTLGLMLDAFEHNPNLGLASCCIYNEDGSVQNTCRRRFPTPWSATVRLLMLHKVFPDNPKFSNFDYGELSSQQSNTNEPVELVEAISGAFMMVRKSALNEVGLLDENYFMHCEDLDWCKRFEASNWHVGFVREASVIHAKGVSSKSRPIKVLWTLHKGMNLFFDKYYYSQYCLPMRLFVRSGIVISFVVRSTIGLVKNLLGRS